MYKKQTKFLGWVKFIKLYSENSNIDLPAYL